MAKVKETARVVSQQMLADGIFSMWIETPAITAQAVPGQFISIYTHDADKLLPRPISLCEIDREQGRLRVVYRVAGEGTKEFSCYQAGDPITILGPLGNGFPKLDKKALLIGGGIGVPPMLQLAKELNCEKTAVLGYRNADMFLKSDFDQVIETVVATEDGSVGTKGTVIDAICACGLDAEVIYTCGPTPMLRAIKAYAQEKGITCYISMEERMACGIGACLACVCKTKEKDHHSNVNNKRICKDGPVFLAEEVEL